MKKITAQSPFNDYDQIENIQFETLNTQLNTTYRTVADTSFVTTEQQSFFNNKTEIANENIATPCNHDPNCNMNIY